MVCIYSNLDISTTLFSVQIECRCEERIAEEQKRCREAIARVERDRDAQLSAFSDRLAAAEAEASDLKQEVISLMPIKRQMSHSALPYYA